MKPTRLIVILAIFAAVAIVTADAHAMYHPRMGRFLQRDPGPGAGSPARVGAAGPAMGGGFAQRDPVSQYADGMNLYRYCRNRPLSLVDPLGTMPVPGLGSDGQPQYDWGPETPEERARMTVIRVRHWRGESCCKSELDSAIHRANVMLSRPKCRQWFVDHGASGVRTFDISAHSSRLRVMCYIAPMWTKKTLNWRKVIRVCPSACDFGDVGMASLLIHEAAHHYCPLAIFGGEACAESAQEACR